MPGSNSGPLAPQVIVLKSTYATALVLEREEVWKWVWKRRQKNERASEKVRRVLNFNWEQQQPRQPKIKLAQFCRKGFFYLCPSDTFSICCRCPICSEDKEANPKSSLAWGPCSQVVVGSAIFPGHGLINFCRIEQLQHPTLGGCSISYLFKGSSYIACSSLHLNLKFRCISEYTFAWRCPSGRVVRAVACDARGSGFIPSSHQLFFNPLVQNRKLVNLKLFSVSSLR